MIDENNMENGKVEINKKKSKKQKQRERRKVGNDSDKANDKDG